ncbi:MAG: hypothetical protein KAX49_03275 [Halanaerobiales bacterium]|nr:hypothetical protein [Halanaerobiales bacterium]
MEIKKRFLRPRPLIICLIIILIVIVLLGGFYLFGRTDFTGPVQAKVSLNQETFLIGDEMILSIEVLTEPGYTVEIPEIALPEGISLKRKETKEPTKSWNRFKRITNYKEEYYFTTLEAKEYQLPEILILVTSPDGGKIELKEPGPALIVESLLTDDSSDIRDLKPVADAPRNPLLYYLLAGLVLLIVIGYLIYRWWKRKFDHEDVNVEPPLPAHAIAYRRFLELDVSDLIERGMFNQYYTILSQIVREYIENRFRVRAQEMTTQEFLHDALCTLNLTTEHQRLLKDFMYQADLVKYAQYLPTLQQIREALVAGKRFVDETKEVEEGGETDV